MMVLNKDYARSRILAEQGQLDTRDQMASTYFKSREEPIFKPQKKENDLEMRKNEEETSFFFYFYVKRDF